MFFVFQQKTAYEMRISDWGSDGGSADLATQALATAAQARSNLARIDEVHRLSGGKVPSQTERDAARAEAARADAAVKVAEAQIAQTRAALSSAQTNLSKATIYSPVKGVVLSDRKSTRLNSSH